MIYILHSAVSMDVDVIGCRWKQEGSENCLIHRGWTIALTKSLSINFRKLNYVISMA